MWKEISAALWLFCVQTVSEGAVIDQRSGLSWFVHLTDIHVTQFEQQQMHTIGAREDDLRDFAHEILRPVSPYAILISGDLVDAKTRLKRGQQNESEWQAYRELLDYTTRHGGVSEETIIDLRGNHDVFDVSARGSHSDFFGLYAATGRRNASRRVWVLPLPDASNGHQRLDHLTTAKLPDDRTQPCSTATLIGLDLTPAPGLRGPTDFFGRADLALLREIDTSLRELKAANRAAGCGSTIIVGSHYPLPIIIQPDTARHDQRPRSAPTCNSNDEAADRECHVNHGSVPGDGTLRGLLLHHGVAASLSGHLHSLFTHRLHVIHRGPSGGYLAEMESTAWKDERRFRIVVTDRGAVSFCDLFYRRRAPAVPPPPMPSSLRSQEAAAVAASPPGRYFDIVALDETRVVAGHIVIMAAPPDNRLSPLGATWEAPRRYTVVRALAFPLQGATVREASLQWRCSTSDKTSFKPMDAAQQPLLTATLDHIRCEGSTSNKEGSVMMQVVVIDGSGGRSTSELRAIALAPQSNSTVTDHNTCSGIDESCKAATIAFGTYQLAEPMEPQPLGNTAAARLFLTIADGQMGRFGTRWAYSFWLLHLVGCLLLPRLMTQRYADQLDAQGWVVRMLTGPLLSLQRMSTMRIPWLLQVMYSMYQARGPWFAARFLSEAPLGLYMPAGVLLRPPRLATEVSGDAVAFGWRFIRSPDSLILCFSHWAFTMIPGTLWLSWVLSSWQRDGTSPGTASYQLPSVPDGNGAANGWSQSNGHTANSKASSDAGTKAAPLKGSISRPGGASTWQGPRGIQGGPRVFTMSQAAVGICILTTHYYNLRRLWRLYGPTSVLLSPGFGWTVPLTAMLLWDAWSAGAACSDACSDELAEIPDSKAQNTPVKSCNR